jgi:hypothetical protein
MKYPRTSGQETQLVAWICCKTPTASL